MKKISVLLADDHAGVRDGLRGLLEAEADLSVVGQAANGDEAVRLARELRPDIVILDITMPGMNGIEAARHIRKSSPTTWLLILSAHAAPEYVRQAFDAGADGYVVKQAAGAELVAALRQVLQGRRYLSGMLGDLRQEIGLD